MPWFVLAILAAAIWGIVNILDKYILDKLVKNPIVSFLISTPIIFMIGVLLFFIKGVDPLSPGNLILALSCGICSGLLNIFYFKAAKIEEISRVVPIFYLAPILVAILAAIFLGEIFKPAIYLGIILLIVGTILISTRNIFKIKFNKAFGWMLISAFFFAIFAILVKYLLQFTDYWTILTYSLLGIILVWLPVVFFYSLELKEALRKNKMKLLSLFVGTQALDITARGINFFAISLGFVSLVETLSSIQPFFVLIYSIILSLFWPKILKEEIGSRIILVKLLAIVLMFIGTILIV